MDVYHAPQHDQSPPEVPDQKERAEIVRTGQKLLMLAIAGHLVIASLVLISNFTVYSNSITLIGLLVGLLFFPIYIPSLLLSNIALINICSALRFPSVVTILLCLISFIPLAGFLMLLFVNARATRFLKQAGYRVGFLGAKKLST